MNWIIAWLKHNTARTVGVIVIGSILIGAPITFYKMAFNKGYSKALKDHPTTVITGGTTNIQNNSQQKEAFGIVKIWFLRLNTTF